MKKEPTHFRYDTEDQCYDDTLGGVTDLIASSVRLLEFVAVKETPGGYWLERFPFHYGKRKWVPKISKKRYAYPTKEEAATSLLHRKRMQLSYAEFNLEKAKRELRAAELFTKEDK